MTVAYFLNPLLAAFIFTVASLSLKRGLSLEAGAVRGAFIVNFIFCVCMIPLWWLMPSQVPLEILWIPFLAGLAVFCGSLFQLLALKLGDVSMALPLLGSKVLFVAILSMVLMGISFPRLWWYAVFLSMFGVFLLGYTKKKVEVEKAIKTIILIGFSVGSFALSDVLIAAYGKQFGFGRFVAVQHLVLFLLNFGLIPFFNKPLLDLPSKTFQWILLGGFLMVTQFFILNHTISIYKDATGLNIIYSSRGVWSVLLVWMIGDWFMNAEKDLGRIILLRRFIGALFLIAAIVLVVVGK